MTIYDNDDWTVTEEPASGNRQIARHKKSGRQYERLLHIPMGFGYVSNRTEPTRWIALIEQAEQALQRPEHDYMRRAIRVLAMLGELHKMGFQRLRFHTQDKGIGLRLFIDSTDRFSRRHGAELTDMQGSVLYHSSMKNEYFDWKDAENDNVRQLAAKFIVRFPGMAERGRGYDWAYAGWFQQALGLAERGYFPLVWVDWETSTDENHIYLTKAPDTVRLPKPPGGEG